MNDLVQHADVAIADGEHLYAADPLVQKNDAEQHREQRIDEVAERRLDDPLVLNGPDVDDPVRRDEHAADAQASRARGGPQHRTQLSPASRHRMKIANRTTDHTMRWNNSSAAATSTAT